MAYRFRVLTYSFRTLGVALIVVCMSFAPCETEIAKTAANIDALDDSIAKQKCSLRASMLEKASLAYLRAALVKDDLDVEYGTVRLRPVYVTLRVHVESKVR